MTQWKGQESAVLFCIPFGKSLGTYLQQLSRCFQHTQTRTNVGKYKGNQCLICCWHLDLLPNTSNILLCSHHRWNDPRGHSISRSSNFKEHYFRIKKSTAMDSQPPNNSNSWIHWYYLRMHLPCGRWITQKLNLSNVAWMGLCKWCTTVPGIAAGFPCEHPALVSPEGTMCSARHCQALLDELQISWRRALHFTEKRRSTELLSAQAKYIEWRREGIFLLTLKFSRKQEALILTQGSGGKFLK